MSQEAYLILNEKSIACLVDEEIYYAHFSSNEWLEGSDFEDSFDAYHNLTKGKPFKVIVEFGAHVQISSEARLVAQENKVPAIAEALIINSLGQRILANFYMKIKHQQRPTKVFKNFQDAKTWIDSI